MLLVQWGGVGDDLVKSHLSLVPVMGMQDGTDPGEGEKLIRGKGLIVEVKLVRREEGEGGMLALHRIRAVTGGG